MGISINVANILCGLSSNGFLKCGDRVVDMGSQQMENDLLADSAMLENLAKAFCADKFPQKGTWRVEERRFLPSGIEHLPETAPYANEFYEHLGLKYDCIDFDNSPHSIKLDLNYDEAPFSLKESCSLVTNIGTTEHVVNQLNAFKMMHDLAAPNGIMLHIVPFYGFPAHGMISYTMPFFISLCGCNKYKILDVTLSAWNLYAIPDNIRDFIYNTNCIFQNKKLPDSFRFRDILITLVLQKPHRKGFVVPTQSRKLADEPDGTLVNDFLTR